jgi:hypothetical protein
VFSVAISELFLHCWWATKYFVLPLTVSVKCYEWVTVFDVHEYVHRDTTMKITNKMHYID